MTVVSIVHTYPNLGKLLSNLLKIQTIRSNYDLLSIIIKCFTHFVIGTFGAKDMPQHEARKQRAKALNWASHNIKSKFMDNLTIESLVSSDSKYEQIMTTQLGYSQTDINQYVIRELTDNILFNLEKLENSKVSSENPIKSAHLLYVISSKCSLLMPSKYSKSLVEKICSSTLIEKLINLSNCRSDLSLNFVKSLIRYKYIENLPLQTKIILWRKSTYILQHHIENLIEDILNSKDLTHEYVSNKIHDIVIACRTHPPIYHFISQYIKMLFISSKNNILIMIMDRLNEGLIESFHSTELNKFYTPITSYKLYFVSYLWPLINIIIHEPHENRFISINNCIYNIIIEDLSRKFDVWYCLLQFYKWFIYAKKLIQIRRTNPLKQFIQFILNPHDDMNIEFMKTEH